jgi:hypothetical protein
MTRETLALFDRGEVVRWEAARLCRETAEAVGWSKDLRARERWLAAALKQLERPFRSQVSSVDTSNGRCTGSDHPER